ncbi:MAG: SGNH/GDSL hydrolase family protein [Candidatus Thiodiazotropha taylori]|nr:SGNH/GDSL hydrolase family protein [Candidatus Thiodiazotropha taylori]MCW4285781.1 SGNH/GDSL hydrolase family protein [Candidatus Thiodiazotropha taylori]
MELSGSSTINIETNTTDYFNCIFYHIMATPSNTHIMFYSKPLFNNVLQVIRNEFITPDESVKFAITTHVDGGKRCNIHVDLEQMTFSLDGLGQKHWIEVNFRKMTVAMYKTFVSETDASLFATSNRTSTPTRSVSDDEEYFDIDSSGFEPDNTENMDTDISLSCSEKDNEQCSVIKEASKVNQLMDIMEKIRSLQKQMSQLTSQVNDIMQEYGKNAPQTTNKSSYSSIVQEAIELSDSNDSVSILPQKKVDNQRAQSTEKSKAMENVRNNPDRPSNSISKNGQSSSTRQLRTRERISTNDSNQSNSANTNNSSNVLLIGDSILHGINVKGLRSNVHKHSVSGAKINTILSDIKRFDLKIFSSVIIYIGGNDVANGSDLELFEEKYDQLLQYVMKENANCKVIMCNIGPRSDIKDCENTQFNDIIHGLARQHGHTLADIYSAFHEKDGNVCERFYQQDSIHVNPSGIKRFMRVLHDINSIVLDFDQCNFPRRSGYGKTRASHRRNLQNPRGRGVTNRNVKCLKCGESNHETLYCRHKNQLKCYNCRFYGHKSSLCEYDL